MRGNPDSFSHWTWGEILLNLTQADIQISFDSKRQFQIKMGYISTLEKLRNTERKEENDGHHDHQDRNNLY